ncbi:MotA/TolQ/ExbB proton channel family protein [candidate division KSB1 bacterium]|nr:MotA/TolQ/ExbB proton channel family protein [candidate division KSB1 bacterium]
MELNILETIRSSVTMMILMGCSVMVLGFVFERWLFMKQTSINADQFFMKVRDALKNESLESAITICNTSLAPIAAVVKSGLVESKNSPKAAAEIMDAVAMEQRTKLEKHLNVLGTLGNIAPLIGLFGTVIGIIQAFHALSTSASAGPAVISSGIAEALITTAAGLVVAVPAVVFYNMFLRKVGVVMTEIEAISKKVLVLVGYAG